MKFRIPKLVSDPILGLVDVAPVLSMVDARPFQELAFKHQLGATFLLYPGATHTRKEHSFGTYQRTKALMEEWLAKGFVTKDEATTVAAYALYHDIGHGPFSHAVESLRKIDHKEYGLKLVKGLKKEIEAAGVNHKLFIELFERKHPLYAVVADRNLGTDKLDYLERDAFYTIREGPGVDYLSKYIYFVDGHVVIDEHAIDETKAIQEFYIKITKNVYLRKRAIIIAGLLQAMTYQLMQDGLTSEELCRLTDFGLMGRFELSKNPYVQFGYSCLLGGKFPKTAIELKDAQFVGTVTAGGKQMAIHGISSDEMQALKNLKLSHDFAALRKLESDIAKLAGVSVKELLIVPPLFTERLHIEDVRIYRAGGNIDLMSAVYPHHFRAMEEHAMSYDGFRICAFGEHREKIQKRAPVIIKYILGLINQKVKNKKVVPR